MLPKKNRIGAALRIQHIYKKGLRCNFRFLQFKYLRNNLKQNRFAVMLPKRLGEGGAVERNKIRRRVHEALRIGLTEAFPTPPQTCYDVAVIVHKEAAKGSCLPAGREYEQIEKDIFLFLKKL